MQAIHSTALARRCTGVAILIWLILCNIENDTTRKWSFLLDMEEAEREEKLALPGPL